MDRVLYSGKNRLVVVRMRVPNQFNRLLMEDILSRGKRQVLVLEAGMFILFVWIVLATFSGLKHTEEAAKITVWRCPELQMEDILSGHIPAASDKEDMTTT